MDNRNSLFDRCTYKQIFLIDATNKFQLGFKFLSRKQLTKSNIIRNKTFAMKYYSPPKSFREEPIFGLWGYFLLHQLCG